MPSTFSSLKFEIIGSGEQSNTWGNTTNTNIGTAIEQAITGLSNPVFASDANLTISLTDALGPALQVPRALVLDVTSDVPLTATRQMVVPTIEKQYLVQNNTSGSQSITVKTAAGTGITVPNGTKMHLYVDGVNVVDAVTHFSALTLGAALPVASGGTGVTSSTGTGSNVLSSSPTLVTPNLGTPSALVGTNITGTAAGLTAGNVTTNANLTGMVTSVGNAASLGSFTSANLAAALTDETGSGAAVFATSPTLVTPNLGTPASGTLTNATGLPLTTGVTGILPVANGGSGTATPSLVQGSNITITGSWPNQTISGPTPGVGTVTSVGGTGTVNGISLSGTVTSSGNLTLGGTLSGVSLTTQVTGTLPVANGGTGVTTSTGTGAVVLSNSPTLVTPALGTPASGALTNCTADGTNQVGYRNLPPSGTKTSGYTLVAADVGKFVELGTGGSVTVPAGVFAAGDIVSIFNNTSGTIACTCSAITDVYKAGTDADISSFSITTRGVANILFITATRAVVTGNLA